VKKASKIAIETTKDFLVKEKQLQKVFFVLFTQNDLDIYKKTAKEIL
jgi:O-acetyl-ADP-ribose deacetylase (regulator of RNase III)